MKTPPMVSVCIPAYQNAKGLEIAIDSLLKQEFNDWELIISVNGDLPEIVGVMNRLKLYMADSRVKVFPEERPLPMAENWNLAISKSNGEFLKLLCQDDSLLPDSLSRQVNALQNYPQASLASGARIIINGAGKRLFTRSVIRRAGLYQGREMVRRCIMSGTNIIGDPVNVIWRRSAMEQVGYFDPSVVYCTDIEYWLRLLSVGDLYYDTEPTGFYRIHSEAAATGLAGVTVKDFIHTARLQEKLGTVSLSEYDLKITALKSHLQSKLRQYFYRFLG